ncbi:MAG: M10 family metallopeptidase C-terminal domain-containing protein, partial [Hormoscilla sp. GM102CHS1]|nr:M10 family metallopeptidase C-terminal domain-containing protein [Hormoscilla sp. GM102CHS1]
GTTRTIDVLANDTDANGDQLSVKGITRPFNPQNPGESGTFNSNFIWEGIEVIENIDLHKSSDNSSIILIDHSNLTDGNNTQLGTFEYSITDGDKTSTASVRVWIINIDLPPKAVNDEATVLLGTTQLLNNEGDLIIGDNDLSIITGEKETLEGGAGNDTIIGNRGSDVLLGGAGADIFVYNSLADSSADPDALNEPGDSIVDFNPGEDTIQFEFEVASRTVSIDDVQIETESISSGMATIMLSTHNSFEIILENLDPTTTKLDIQDSIITLP